ncbi:MAG TPA: hypothetical protein VFU78_12645 [Thermomicrobiales bacterium]|nr:hypothetical protein [Thermomicrobiales bacterium]
MSERISLVIGDVIIHSIFGKGVIVSNITPQGVVQTDFENTGRKSISVAPPHDRLISEVNGQPYVPAPVPPPRQTTVATNYTATISPAPTSRVRNTAKPKTSYELPRQSICPRPTEFVAIWWVNQGSTFPQERAGNYLWAPLKDKAGQPQYHWETMSEVHAGDVIVHYCNGAIMCISQARGAAYFANQPRELLRQGWEIAGRRVDCSYVDFRPPISLNHHLAHQLHSLNIDRGPLNKNAMVKQGYLFRFSLAGLKSVHKATNIQWPDWALRLLQNE